MKPFFVDINDLKVKIVDADARRDCEATTARKVQLGSASEVCFEL